MAQFGSKNTPWARPTGAQQLNPQIFTGQLSGMNAFAVSQAAAMGLGAAGLGALGGGVISAVNPAAFAQQQPSAAALANAVGFPAAANAAVAAAVSRQQQVAQAVAHQQQQQQQQQQKNQRTFIGIVTKIHDNYGFVDDDVFFQTSVVRGGVARIGDRVMVEAAFNANMPFKWNAVRIQLLPNQEPAALVQNQPQQASLRHSRGDDRWASDRRDAPVSSRRERSPRRSPAPSRRSPLPPPRGSPNSSRRRSPSPARHGSSAASISLKRERSPATSISNRDNDGRGASRSPPRRRPRLAQGRCAVPKFSLDKHDFGVFDIRKLYSNLYVPSDFFRCNYEWTKGLPLHNPLSLDHVSSFHVLNKEVDRLDNVEAVLDPPDADYRYSAKVMLLSLPGIQEIFKKTIGMEDDEGFLKTGVAFNPIHFHNLVGFLVGTKSKSEVLAVGGPWSPSLDGTDPEDPMVMVRCAIRTTKALTGIDLSKCTQWYKFLEIRYRRADKSGQQQRTIADGQQQQTNDIQQTASDSSPRVDTVTIFLPDVWRVLPSQLEFEGLQTCLKNQLSNKISNLYEPLPPTPPAVVADTTIPTSSATNEENVENHSVQHDISVTSIPEDTVAASADISMTSEGEQQNMATITPAKSEGEEEEKTTSGGKEPTHWSKLDIKSMKVNELRHELSARGIDAKGIKSQLVSRLMKAVKTEQETDELGQAAEAQLTDEDKDKTEMVIDEIVEGSTPSEPMESTPNDVDMKRIDGPESQTITDQKDSTSDDKVEAPKPKLRSEKEIKDAKARLERAYEFRANQPGVLVFPNRLAKNGKFDCRVMSLTALLDYRPEDNKEHSFEVFLFVEAFCQMLMRDNGFNILKALMATPDPSEKDEKATAEKKAKDDSSGNAPETEKESSGQTVEKEDTKEDASAKEVGKDEKKDGSKSSSGKKDGKYKDEKSKRRSRSRSPVRDDKKLVKAHDPLLLQSFVYFDQDYSGYITNKDLEDILLSLGLHLTRSQVLKLTKKVVSRDVLSYRKLTDVIFLKETKEKKSEPTFLPLPSDEELAIGNTSLLASCKEGNVSKTAAVDYGARKSETVDISSIGTVLYKGTLVDVGQILNQIAKLDSEKQTLEYRLSTLEKDLGNYKDQKHSLERRKRRLEDDLKDVKKRLYDAEKCLKNSQDDTVQFKTALHRCKEYSESIARLVDKTFPSKREKDETSSERSDKIAKTKSATSEKGETQETTAATSKTASDTANSSADSTNVQNIEMTKTDVQPEDSQSPAPDEELAVREEVTEADRTEMDSNILASLGGDNTQQ